MKGIFLIDNLEIIKGFTASCFDLLHAGHITMLKEAKNNCDILIVGLQTDPTIDRPSKNKPVQTVYERWVQLAACKYVDEIIPYTTEKELLDILLSQQINIRFIGEEYKDKDFTGKELEDIKLFYNIRKHSFSSTELRNRVGNTFNKNYNYQTSELKDIEQINSLKDIKQIISEGIDEEKKFFHRRKNLTDYEPILTLEEKELLRESISKQLL